MLARAGMAPDAAWRDAGAAGLQPLDPGHPFSPLGDNVPATAFLLASELAFGKPGAVVTLAVGTDPEAPARPTPDLQLAWEFWDGGAWQRLGTSTPSPVAVAGSARGFADGTLALTASGAVTFRSPAAWAAGAQGGVSGYWLRVRVAAGGFTGTPLQAPRLSSLTLGFSWPLPAVTSLGCDIAVTRPPAAPDLAFQDTAPLETSKDFRPFGDRPRVGDALVVSSAAFARPAPGGTHAVTLRARRSALDPAALPDGTTAVELVWEYQTAAGWQLLGRSVSPPATEPPENARFGFHDGSAAFTLDTPRTARRSPSRHPRTGARPSMAARPAAGCASASAAAATAATPGTKWSPPTATRPRPTPTPTSRSCSWCRPATARPRSPR